MPSASSLSFWFLSSKRNLKLAYCTQATILGPVFPSWDKLTQDKCQFKAGFHWRQSRSRSRKSNSDLVKIENGSRKRSHKLDGIGVGRIRTVPFCSDSACDSDAYDPVENRLSESQAKVLGLFFGFHLRLRQSSFYWIISVGVISGIGRKWNRSDSAYDSDFRFSLGRKRLCLRLRLACQ